MLPEYDNRLKKNLTIYQDVEYMNSVNINEVETKYTFTTRDMMEWLNDKDLTQEEFKAEYYKYLNSRFNRIKEIIKKNVFKL